MSKERELLRQALDAISRGGMTPNEEFLAAEISAFLAAKPEVDELKDDAFNLLIALQEAWPYVHDGCTIKSKKERITHLLRKHGDFADLYQPRPEPASKPMSENDSDQALENASSYIDFLEAEIRHLRESRKPLSDDEIDDEWLRLLTSPEQPGMEYSEHFLWGVRYAEKYYGIGGDNA